MLGLPHEHGAERVAAEGRRVQAGVEGGVEGGPLDDATSNPPPRTRRTSALGSGLHGHDDMYIRVSTLLPILALLIFGSFAGCYAASAGAESPETPGMPDEPWSTVLTDARIDLPCNAGLNAATASIGRGDAYVVDGCGMRVVYAASVWSTGGRFLPHVVLLSRLPIPPSGTVTSPSRL